MTIRRAILADVPSMTVLFQRTVLRATIRDYSEAQRQIWAERGNDIARWKSRVLNQCFLLAEHSHHLLGMGSITTEGHIDVLYVHHAHQGEGVATKLLIQLEERAREQRLVRITTDASITARPFFECRGYLVVKEQPNTLGDQVLVNYRMEKIL